MNIQARILSSYKLAHPPRIDLDLKERRPVDPEAMLQLSAMTGSMIRFGKDVVVESKGFIKTRATGSRVLIGSNTTLDRCRFTIQGENSAIVIGPSCRIRALQIAVRDSNSLFVIGAGTTWEHGTVLCNSGCSIIIGNECMFSTHIALRNRDGHGIFDATTRELINPPRDVIIGSHVWLGSGVRVNKGAVIGGGTVVGQASVVSGRLKGSSIYAGVPARMVRSNVIWSRTMNPDDIPEIYSTVSKDITDSPDPTSI